MANTRVTTPVTDFDKATSLPGLKIPSGDNSNQPAGAAAEQGMIRNDTEETVDSSDSAIAHYNGTAWQYFAATESADPVVPLENFNTVLYIGDGNTSNPQTNIGFSPNLVWIADRDGGNYNPIQDSVRGVDSVLVTALTAAEQSSSWRNSYGQITSFDSDGFNVSDGSGNTNSNFNQSGRDYVAWCWKAGGAAVPNTNGDVQSNVSANVAGGFSIVKGTGSGSGVQSAGHGLSSAPEFILVKNINATDNWFCLVPGLTSTNYYMRLNTTDAEINNGTPTIFADSTTVSVRQNSMGSWGNLIAYCFHSVPGYSKVGSFVGTGAAGLKITLDFQPAWLMIKRTSTTGAWTVIDNKINTASIKKNYIKINEIGEENTATTGIVFEIDGFSFSGGSFNQSGQTAMYLAFA